MSAEILRRAADAIYHDLAFGQEHGDEKFLVAVAQWLGSAHLDWLRLEHSLSAASVRAMGGAANTPNPEALAVARAYLGEQP